MPKNSDRKTIAKEKLHIAIENLKQAELEGANLLTPVTYRLAKIKIYENRKKILAPSSSQRELEEAADDASAACAQLLSSVLHAKNADKNQQQMPDLIENEAINNWLNEGGLVT